MSIVTEPAPLPADEPTRLVALARMRLLGAEPDPSLDALTALAASSLGVPIALVSLIDGRRQWYISSVGWNLQHTPRNEGVCTHTLLAGDVLAVSDLAHDDRFAHLPLSGAGGTLRAYAGIALHCVHGHRVGTLCVLDTKPRQWTEQEQAQVRGLGCVAENRLQALCTVQQLKTQTAERDATYRIIAHDLPSPVRQVLGLLEVLQTSPHEAGTLIPMAMRSARRLQRLARGLKEYTRLSQPVHAEAVHLAEAATGAWEELEEVGSATLVLSDDLPTVPANRLVLNDILSNVFSNAVTHSGRPDVQVTVCARLEEGLWRIAISDNGLSELASDSERLFRVFWQQQPDESRERIGIGLAVVRRLVADLGCQAGAESNPDGGLSVWFTWPALP